MSLAEKVSHLQNFVSDKKDFEENKKRIALTESYRDMQEIISEWTRESYGTKTDYETCSKMKELYCKATTLKNSIDTIMNAITSDYRGKMSRVNHIAKSLTKELDWIRNHAKLKVGACLSQAKRDAQRGIIHSFEEKAFYDDDNVHVINKTVNNWKVDDVSKVPQEYLKIDEEKIDKLVKAGLLNIPGIDIFEETTTTLRLK